MNTTTTQRTSKPIKLITALGFFGTAISVVAWMAGATWAPFTTFGFVSLWIGGRIAAWWFHG